MAEKGCDYCGAQHYVEQDVMELHQQAQQRASALRRRQPVRPVLDATVTDIGFIEPAWSRLQMLLDVLWGECVPRFRLAGGKMVNHQCGSC